MLLQKIKFFFLTGFERLIENQFIYNGYFYFLNIGDPTKVLLHSISLYIHDYIIFPILDCKIVHIL